MKISNLFLAAAVSGIMAGAAGTAYAADEHAGDKPAADAGKDAADKHGCKGMNSCKGKGGCMTEANACAGKNDCKGKGGCATARHDCKGKNDCKAQGKGGKNDCKGKGDCSTNAAMKK
jgi:hypothetical protein